MAKRLLNIYLGERHTGELMADDEGRLTFRYLEGRRSQPLSLSLPSRDQPYADKECRPFFAGLLPEGTALQQAAAARRLEVYETFRLLEAFGGECAGAVRLLPPGVPPSIRHDYELLTDAALTKAIADLEVSPNFARDDRVRLSLAGAQNKAAVKVTGEGIFKPLGGSPSTHILKIGSERYPDLAKNEGFCLKLAHRMGLAVAECELREAGGRYFLLVERYDRSVRDGVVIERHQEDFCQALGYGPADKYEIDDQTGLKVGPGLDECFALVRKTRHPAADLEGLLRRIVFNYLIGNADAHAKNFSLLYGETANPVLAPAYDLVSTRLYPELTARFAMRHGGVTEPDDMDKAAWGGVARAAGVRLKFFQDLVAEMAGRILDNARALMVSSFNHHPPYAHILNGIGERVQRLSDEFNLGITTDTGPVLLKAPGWSNLS